MLPLPLLLLLRVVSPWSRRRLRRQERLLLLQEGALHSTVQVELRDDRITRDYVVRNPRKLTGLHASIGAVL